MRDEPAQAWLNARVRLLSRRSAAFSLSVLLVLAVADAAGADASPINPNNRPTPLAGAVNGVVPMSRLVNVGPNCVAAREAGPSLARIFAMAREVERSRSVPTSATGRCRTR